MSVEQSHESRRLPDDVAQRLLARAVELEHARQDGLSVTQLRAVAAEAGVSQGAFEAALAETLLPSGDLQPDLASSSDAPTGWRSTVAVNLVALAAFVGVLVLAVAAHRLVNGGVLLRKAIDPAALALGTVVAARLRARPVAALLAGLAIAQGAEFAMDAAYGVPAVRGAGAHFALMLAGVAGVLLGVLLARAGRRWGGDARVATHLAPSPPAEATAQGETTGPRRLLSLWPRPA